MPLNQSQRDVLVDSINTGLDYVDRRIGNIGQTISLYRSLLLEDNDQFLLYIGSHIESRLLMEIVNEMRSIYLERPTLMKVSYENDLPILEIQLGEGVPYGLNQLNAEPFNPGEIRDFFSAVVQQAINELTEELGEEVEGPVVNQAANNEDRTFGGHMIYQYSEVVGGVRDGATTFIRPVIHPVETVTNTAVGLFNLVRHPYEVPRAVLRNAGRDMWNNPARTVVSCSTGMVLGALTGSAVGQAASVVGGQLPMLSIAEQTAATISESAASTMANVAGQGASSLGSQIKAFNLLSAGEFQSGLSQFKTLVI